MFHFHQWSNWAITETGKIWEDGTFGEKSKIMGSYMTQFRFCQICNKAQIRTQTTASLIVHGRRLVPDPDQKEVVQNVITG